MAWSASKVLVAFVVDSLCNTVALDLNADGFKAALFDNTVTPSQTATSANSCYGAGAWASGGVSDATGWPAAGRSLTSVTVTDNTATTFVFDAADTVSANDTTTISGAYGTLVYDDTMTSPADQGVSYHYFGGVASVTSGRFTIIWNAGGLISLAL